MAKRTSKKVETPTTATELLGEALTAAAPDAGRAYQVVKAKVSEPIQAATSRMSRRGKAMVWLAGLLMAGSMASFGVNSVARPAIASVAKSTLGPGYRIQCQLPSGNFGVCPGWKK